MIERLIDCKHTREIVPPLSDGMISRFNPSVCYDHTNNEFVISVREASYTLYETEKGAQTFFYNDKRRYYSELYITRTECPLYDELEWNYIKQNDKPDKNYQIYKGAEDVRLIQWNDKIYCSCTRKDWNKDACSKMEETILIDNEMTSPRMLVPRQRTEKNYVPIENLPQNYIYQIFPTIILKEDNTFVEYSHRQNIGDYVNNFRGSSQVVNYRDKYLTIVHTRDKQQGYLHYFVIFDKNWKINSVSEPFRFDNNFVEFCCGLCIHENQVYITYGLSDRRAFITKFDIRELDKINFKNNTLL